MASGWTNKGKYRALDIAFRGAQRILRQCLDPLDSGRVSDAEY